MTRRKLLAMLGSAVALGAAGWRGFRTLGKAARVYADDQVEVPEGPPLPTRPLGKTGEKVTIIALGGAHVERSDRPVDLARLAVDRGVLFVDTAWDYGEGRSEKVLGEALSEGGRRDKVFLMSKCCAHGKWTKALAEKRLEESLARLRTDRLDLYQLHDLKPGDPAKIFARGGAIEALEAAKKAGKIRFTGFTGHFEPAVHQEMLANGFPFDTCQMPVNPADPTVKSFVTGVLPKLAERGVAVLGMKALGDNRIVASGAATAQECRRYALSQPIATLVCGIRTRADLAQDLAIARGFTPMSDEEQKALVARIAPRNKDAALEWYKQHA